MKRLLTTAALLSTLAMAHHTNFTVADVTTSEWKYVNGATIQTDRCDIDSSTKVITGNNGKATQWGQNKHCYISRVTDWGEATCENGIKNIVDEVTYTYKAGFTVSDQSFYIECEPEKGTEQHFYTVDEPIGDNCPTGGTRFGIYEDLNFDDEMQYDEIITTHYTCNGTNGTDGEDGADGINGTNGTDGTNGTNGTDGTNGEDGTDGTNGADGTDGEDGTNGTNGTNGINGINGTDGINGTNGTDGSSVSCVDGNNDCDCTVASDSGGVDGYTAVGFGLGLLILFSFMAHAERKED